MAARRHRVAAFLVLSALLSACSDRRPLAPVKGTVTLDGKPLAKGTIVFEAAGCRPATGTIVNGEIVEVTTYNRGDGAAVGQHKVAISANEDAASAEVANPGQAPMAKGNYMVGKSLIPAQYNDPNTSGLAADIKKGENRVEFKLATKPRQ